jgi:hypothetical protein
MDPVTDPATEATGILLSHTTRISPGAAPDRSPAGAPTVQAATPATLTEVEATGDSAAAAAANSVEGVSPGGGPGRGGNLLPQAVLQSILLG